MPCYHPIQAFKGSDGQVVFAEHLAKDAVSIELPCGRCVGCRLERSRQWAIRCLHEAKMHESSCFLTLSDKQQVITDRQHSMELLSMSKPECAVCRKECQDRLAQQQQLMIENDRIQNQKLDNLLMMVANVHNGLGGVANGLGKQVVFNPPKPHTTGG